MLKINGTKKTESGKVQDIKTKVQNTESKEKNIKPNDGKDNKSIEVKNNKILEFLRSTKLAFDTQLEISAFLNKFEQTLVEAGLYTQSQMTFSAQFTQKTDYGYTTRIYTPLGLNLTKLEEAVQTLQDSLQCRVILTRPEEFGCLDVKFITKMLVNDSTPYKVKTVKPWELYIGIACDGTDVVLDISQMPFILLCGATRSGKSKMIDCMLMSLINSCSPMEVELWLAQVAKNDLVIYEDAECTRCFADTLEKVDIMMEHLKIEMKRRMDLLRPYRKKDLASNYLEYNGFAGHMPLSTIHVVFDELASLYDLQGCTDKVKKLKQSITGKIDEVAQYGAGLGINGIFCLQRPTHDKLSPFVKSQSNIKISFKQNNTKSSEVATDDPQIALGLKKREAVYFSDKYDFVKVPNIPKGTVYKVIQSKLKPNHRMLDLSSYPKTDDDDNEENKKSKKKQKKTKSNESENEETSQSDEPITKEDIEEMKKLFKSHFESALALEKRPPVTYDKVETDYTKLAKVAEQNAKKYGWKPYEPSKNTTVVKDETKLAFMPSQKPIKKPKGDIS